MKIRKVTNKPEHLHDKYFEFEKVFAYFRYCQSIRYHIVIESMKLTEKQVVQYLQQGSNTKKRLKAVYWINYNSHLNKAAHKALLNLKASVSDIEDVLQEGKLALIEQIEKGNYQRKRPLTNYFVGICKNIYRKNYLANDTAELTEMMQQGLERNIEYKIMRKEQLLEYGKIWEYLLDHLHPDCKKILMMQFLNYPSERIASEMNFKLVSSVKTKVYKCREKLREFMKNNDHIARIIKSRLYEKF